jgi:hypothetical protein
MLQCTFKLKDGARCEVESVGAVGRNKGIQGGNVLIRINDTPLDPNITREAFNNMRTKTPKPFRCLFLREQTAVDESNDEADQAMQEIGSKYVSSSYLTIGGTSFQCNPFTYLQMLGLIDANAAGLNEDPMKVDYGLVVGGQSLMIYEKGVCKGTFSYKLEIGLLLQCLGASLSIGMERGN